MTFKNVKIGPVVGYTQPNKIRFMAGLTRWKRRGKLNCGWIRLKDSSASQYSDPVPFRFNSDFYYTGVVEIGALSPDTVYSYQICYHKELKTEPPEESDWNGIKEYTARTAKEYDANSKSNVRLGFGSCLHSPSDERSGKVLRALTNEHESNKLDAFLWLGDQIYNDEWLGMTPFNTLKKHFKYRYKQLFQNRYVSRILSAMPNYMIMDDHELSNDYVHGPVEYRAREKRRFEIRLEHGLQAYYAYQLSHGRVFDVENPDPQTPVTYLKGQGDQKQPSTFYTQLAFGDVGVFMTDTRNERNLNQIIDEVQYQALEKFLLSEDYRVKVVATSVTFLADGHKTGDPDNWSYTAESQLQRKNLIHAIRENDIKNVFFIAGDVHCHFACQLEHEGQPTGIHELVSAAIFWPVAPIFRKDVGQLFRLNYGNFCFGDPLKGAEELNVKLSQPKSDLPGSDGKGMYQENGFGLIDISDDKLLFRVKDSNGLDRIRYTFPLS